jgi:hypothetical protein
VQLRFVECRNSTFMNTMKNSLALGLVLVTGLGTVPASAQTHKKHHISPVVAGVAAYEVAKHTGKSGHKNVLQRHPVLTGLGAAYLAHKHNKKHH